MRRSPISRAVISARVLPFSGMAGGNHQPLDLARRPDQRAPVRRPRPQAGIGPDDPPPREDRHHLRRAARDLRQPRAIDLAIVGEFAAAADQDLAAWQRLEHGRRSRSAGLRSLRGHFRRGERSGRDFVFRLRQVVPQEATKRLGDEDVSLERPDGQAEPGKGAYGTAPGAGGDHDPRRRDPALAGPDPRHRCPSPCRCRSLPYRCGCPPLGRRRAGSAPRPSASGTPAPCR